MSAAAMAGCGTWTATASGGTGKEDGNEWEAVRENGMEGENGPESGAGYNPTSPLDRVGAAV